MPDTPPNADFWKRKLAAFLHDPPSKCLDIRNHEEQARTLLRQAGFVAEDEVRRLGDLYAKPSDWTASAADRFPFPKSRGNLESAFDGVRACFHHPLSAGATSPFHKEFASVETAMEVDQTVQPVAGSLNGWPEGEVWRARFFCHWRLWEKFCTEKDYRFGFLPADTRLPDHSVWTHMQVVSALNSCSDGTGNTATLRPAFLKFQLGPVQDFIAEARSVRDLWSGSYLLSWLMAAGMKALALECGPDAVVYPNLKGQPLFDLHLRDGLWSQVEVNGRRGWDLLGYEADRNALLTPNLPNVFLAVVHRDQAGRIGRLVEKSIRDEWTAIARNVWEFCDRAGMIPSQEAGLTASERRVRFDGQIERFLSVAWKSTPWPDTLEGALSLVDGLRRDMPACEAADRVKAIVEYATTVMPQTDRDGRYYVGGDAGPKTTLNNIGLAWSVVITVNGWQLDAVRQTRDFPAWLEATGGPGTMANKDSLGGRSEAVGGGREWAERARQKGGAWATLFKHEDWLGASTLIKRLWHLAYLKEKWGLPTASDKFKMPNTHMIAAHRPNESGDDEEVEKLAGEKYFAVLALDGDEIGKWVSGEKTPPLGDQFSDYADATGAERQGAKAYFVAHRGETLLGTARPLSPGYHLQFSKALSDFALLCARPIVEHFDGRLIYAGGDDVLAMLPADTAIECAEALRRAFRGEGDTNGDLGNPAPGFLTKGTDGSGHPIPFIAPGPQAEVSVGIAIAHFKAPLQDVVRAAQAAEKRAKRATDKGGLGRAALAVSLMKRSGEIIEWGAKWDNGGLDLYRAVAGCLDSKDLSGKFPHRVCELLEPYLAKSKEVANAAAFDAPAVIREEFCFAVRRQSARTKANDNEALLVPALGNYLNGLGADPQTLLQAVTGLCSVAAFAHRTHNPKADRQNP